jgi:integrase/recombinase XerD
MSEQTQTNNFHTASAAFLESLPISKEPTRQTYAAALAAFAQYLQQAKDLSLDTPPNEYPEKILLDFFLWLDRKGYSSFTLNTYLAALRRFFLFHYTARNLGPEFDIVRAQSLLKGKLKLHYPQTKAPDELPSLVLYYDQQPLPPAGGGKEASLQHLCLLRDRAILHTLYATAGRVSEVAALTRQDVAEGETDEVLITGKGGKERWLYLTPEALVAIRAYLAKRDDFKTGLFVSHGRDSGKKLSRTSLWRVVKKAAEAVGLPDVSPHTFRHWRATQMLNDEVPLEIIQELLGHSDIGTTRKVYAHSKRQRVKEAFQKHSPSPQQAMDNNQQDESPA